MASKKVGAVNDMSIQGAQGSKQRGCTVPLVVMSHGRRPALFRGSPGGGRPASSHRIGGLPTSDITLHLLVLLITNYTREDVKKVLEILHAARPEPKEGLFTFGIGMHSATLA